MGKEVPSNGLKSLHMETRSAQAFCVSSVVLCLVLQQ